jgi:hypothetical protein
MAEIAPPHIEPISDPSAGSQERNASRDRARTVGAGKVHSPRPPEVGAPEESERHELDEMA